MLLKDLVKKLDYLVLEGENPFAKKKDDEEDKDKDEDKDTDTEDAEGKDAEGEEENVDAKSVPKKAALKNPNDTKAEVESKVAPKNDAEHPGGEEKTLPQPMQPPKVPSVQAPVAPSPTFPMQQGVPQKEEEVGTETEDDSSVLTKELGKFVQTARAFTEVINVLKDVIQPPVAPAAAPAAAPAVPAPTAAPAAAEPVQGSPTAFTPGGNATPAVAAPDEVNAQDNASAEAPIDDTGTEDTESDSAETPVEGNGELTDEVKAAFKSKPGKKKFDPNTGTVYWSVNGKTMKAPSNNPDAEEEVTDQELLATLKF